MPLYLDRHDIPGVTAEQVADAHLLDLAVEQKHGVRYLTYFLEPAAGSIFCLAEGPNKEAVEEVHREAHGLMASSIIEVEHGTLQSFLGPIPTHPPGAVFVDRAVRAVLFTDICGSTALTHAHGDDVSRALVREHDSIVRDALARFDGREVKHTGDGIMAVFVSAASAVKAGMNIHQELAHHRKDHPDQPIQVRIGVASGEPIEHHNDLFGTTVQLAARLCAHAGPEQILASNTVAELCTGKSLPFADVGEVNLKGFSHPVHAHGISCVSE